MIVASLKLPYRGKIRFSSPYGDRILNGASDWHNGIDLVGLDEKLIRAPCAARVGVSTILNKETDRTRTWEWGNYVRLDCDDGARIYFCHLSERYVQAGQTVSAGEPIGAEGATGYAFGSHLHFEVRYGDRAVNPCPLLGIENSAGILLQGDPVENWYDADVAWAQEAGVLLGVGNGQLDLDSPCTRAQMCAFLHRLYNKIHQETGGT